MRAQWTVIVLGVSLAGCNLVAEPSPPAQDKEIFYGVASVIDGAAVDLGASKLSLSVMGSADGGRAFSYRLYVDCEDKGFRSAERNGAWTSFGGSADPEFASIVHCPEADPARYNRVVQIMGGGGDLNLGENEAVLKSPLGEARFRVSARPID